jgi:AcrR family transcriptional regulator
MSFENIVGEKGDGVLPAKQARSQRRQRAILDAAHRLLESVGYEKMKMEQIAAEAQSSVGTLYQRFSNKEGLLDALLGETLIQLDNLIATELTADALADDRREAILKLVTIVVNFMRDNQGFVRAITSRQLQDPKGVTPLQHTAREAVMRTWTAITANDDRLDDPAIQLRYVFGMQLVIGAATNAILNRPGPLLIDDPRLPDALAAMVDHMMMDSDQPPQA